MGIAFFAVALWLLNDVLRHLHYRQIVAALDEMPAQRITLALVLTALAYTVLTGYDLLGFRFIGRQLPLRRLALGSFLGFAFGNNVGHTLLTGATTRYWIYVSSGVPAADIARVAVFCSLGFWLGYLFMAGLAFVLEPVALPATLRVPLANTRPLGLLLLALLSGYGVLVAMRKARLRIAQWEFSLPSAQLTAGQLAIATLDLALMTTTLWVLLPAELALSWLQFVPIFLLALVAGTASQVPGGLGVFETVIVVLLPDTVATPHVIAALLAFRGVYYVTPLLLAIAIAALHAGGARAAWLRTWSDRVGRWTKAAVPQVLTLAVFFAGALLLVSGALPAAAGRLRLLAHAVPLILIEASQFLASLAGTVLLLLARGLQRRLDAAYVVAVVLLGAGIVLSLVKGFDYEEAVVLAFLLAALAPCRAQFYRRASLFATPLTWGWITSIAIVLAGSLWLLAFAFKHVEYSNELWWHFALHAEAPRALRATVGAVVLSVALAGALLLRPARPRPAITTAADIERARPIVAHSAWTYANLVLRGDKALLFSRSAQAFLMYGRRGRSWIAMGDPIGPKEEAAELAWQFRDLCDRYGGWPVFYEVRPENLDLYIDLGLTLTKLGEEARVDLAAFDLATPARAQLRQARAKIVRAGCRFEIVPVEDVPAIVPQLEAVSRAWLTRKATREKGFSNASFDSAYLQHFPVAVVRRGATVIAFANLWLGAEK
ncbi:MAG TPA: bifunctional lysylphosphatidylglycerol flippase/synthetase MprF, partial [Burkholderiaceae bacterium]|nr:bifunctional lysylphosphatidylglycerol flippase/synthetase MprF [Burkholderiaceae bacterium]